MDKKEYQEKLNEINRLVAVEDYSSAAQVADSIDWKRVRNVQTLLMVSEIYEAVNRYQDSKILLLRAYRRSPLGRTVLYRLVECTVALKQFDEAIEYYSEYVQAAPRDNNKYILKYKIYRGRGSSLDEQINILKEYLEQEKDSERWSYELAKLYKEAGRTQECINTCDDLVLWYQSGKYVIKALELKKKIAPLTPRQQEIYDSRFGEKDPDDDTDEETEASYLQQARAERAALQQDAIKSELAEDVSKAARKKEAERQRQEAAVSAQAQTGGRRSGADSERPADARQPEKDVMPGQRPDERAGNVPAYYPERTATENAQTVQTQGAAKTPDAEGAGQAESALPPARSESEAADDGVHYDEKNLKKNLAESMRKIVSGVGPRDEVDEEQERLDRVIEQSKEDQEAAVASRGLGMTISASGAEEKKPQAPKLTIDDILLSMGDKGNSVRRAAAGNGSPLPAGVLPAEEEAKMNTRASEQMSRAASAAAETVPAGAAVQQMPAETAPGEAAAQQMPAETVTGEAAVQQMPAETVSGEAAVQQTATLRAAPGGTENGSPHADAHTAPGEYADAADAEENAPQTETNAGSGKPADAGGAAESAPPVNSDAETSAEETSAESAGGAKEGAAYVNTGAQPAEDAAAVSSSGPDDAEENAPVKSPVSPEDTQADRNGAAQNPDEDILEAKTRVLPTAEIAKLHEQFLQEKKTARSAGARMAEKIAAEAEAQAKAAEAAEGTATASGSGDQAAPSAEPEGAESDAPDGGTTDMRELQPRADIPQPQPQENRSALKPYQRELFRGFFGIGNLEEQIANAVSQAESKGGDRTSRTGNILILGGHGCGKTTIATGIAKAVAEDTGTHTVKMARIYAADLNRKDIAATIAKIAGGVLIIEEAGDLEDSIVDQLTTAMEFRTDGMIMILEDEQRYVHDLLMRHPRFTMKFTAQIIIPAFTSAELVNFGELFAESRDCTFSEEARQALTARMEAAEKAGEAVSITNVIELTNRAVRNSGGFFRRIQSAKKRYDSQNRVILRAKDLR